MPKSSSTAVVLATRLPYPPQAGYDMRTWEIVKALASDGRAAAFGLTEGVTPRPPDPGVVAWGASQDPTVAAAPYDGARALEWLRDPLGHPSDRMFSPAAAEELIRFSEPLSPGLVVIETPWLHRYIEPVRRLGCRIVLDAHNVEGSLARELARSAGDPLTAKLAARVAEIEASAFAAVDEVWVCSDDEAALVHDVHAATPVAVVPNTIEVERYGPPQRTAGQFVTVYTATFGYPPNITAVRRLIEGIFPALWRDLPEARLALVGRDPTPLMQAAAAEEPRVEVTGLVDDVAPHLRRASAMAVPLVEGGGTRFKVLEAFASGVPVVSTRKGVEGLAVSSGEHYLEAESDADFVEALLRLDRDPPLGERLAARGLALVRERYSFEAARRAVNRKS